MAALPFLILGVLANPWPVARDAGLKGRRYMNLAIRAAAIVACIWLWRGRTPAGSRRYAEADYADLWVCWRRTGWAGIS